MLLGVQGKVRKELLQIDKILEKVCPNLQNLKTKSYIKDSQAKTKEYDIDDSKIIDCSLGVNPYGSSSLAKEAVCKINWDDVNKYPDPSYTVIKKAIIDSWSNIADIEEDEIFLGAGSIGTLIILNRLFVQKGSKVLGYCPQFSEYENIVNIVGGIYDFVEMEARDNFKFPHEKFLKAINPSYAAIYIDNPNNPTGQIVPISIIEEIIKRAANFGIPVIVDEAYGDYMDNDNSAIKMCDKYPNLIVVRSFSKGLGLANIRLGYLVVKGPLKEYYNTVNIPVFAFPDIMSKLIVETLKDKSFIIKCIQNIKENKARLVIACKDKFTIAKTSPETPIITLGCNEGKNLYDYFLQHGIITAPGDEFRNLGKNYVRLRIPSDIEKLIERIGEMN